MPWPKKLVANCLNNMITTVNYILGFLTMVAQISIVIFVLSWIFFRKDIGNFAKKMPSVSGLKAAFVVSLVATLGSLFYSQIAGFVPCELCWFQRIFMYPQVILLGLAIIRKKEDICDYGLALAFFGILFSLYQNYLIYAGASSSCSATGSHVSCTAQYVLAFGFVTIPLMALTAFILIIFLLLVQRLAKEA